MNTIAENIRAIRATLPQGVTLVCVSKYQPMSFIVEAYEAGERDFGESHVQELCAKHEALPKDIHWHMIGHLQTNKVKYIVPFVHLIQSVDSWRLLEVINREAEKIQRVVHVLLEVHVAKEETKSGMTIEEMNEILPRLAELQYVQVDGLMTMATNTDDETEIRRCFSIVRQTSDNLQPAICNLQPIRSMGMSDDYKIAIEEGSNMVRVGSSIFGER